MRLLSLKLGALSIWVNKPLLFAEANNKRLAMQGRSWRMALPPLILSKTEEAAQWLTEYISQSFFHYFSQRWASPAGQSAVPTNCVSITEWLIGSWNMSPAFTHIARSIGQKRMPSLAVKETSRSTPIVNVYFWDVPLTLSFIARIHYEIFNNYYFRTELFQFTNCSGYIVVCAAMALAPALLPAVRRSCKNSMKGSPFLQRDNSLQ